MCRFLFIVMSVILPGSAVALTTVPFTLEDRDRLIRLEERLDALEKTIDARFATQVAKFDLLQNQTTDIKTDIRTMMYFFLGGLLGLIGFILWDRRTFLKPFESDVKDLHKTNEKIIDALKKQAKTNPSLAEILRSVGLV